MAGQETQRRARILAPTPQAIACAAARLQRGALIAVPTETVYGLAGLACDDSAVARIFAVKGRPTFNPLISHVDSLEMAEQVAVFNPVARQLAARFWPGPLTLVLPRSAACPVSALACAGLDTIAVRWPDHPVIQALIGAVGAPLAAPSANRSGRISPTCAGHVAAGLGTELEFILDGGRTHAGVESTVVAVNGEALSLLRPGPITVDALMVETGQTVAAAHTGTGVRAPGMLSAHYAPGKPLRLNAQHFAADEYGIGFGAVAGHETLSASGDVVEAAGNLFAALHRGDAAAFARIAVAPVPATGIGAAINDRLLRAATGSPSEDNLDA